MNQSSVDALLARAQVGLAFFYGLVFVGMFVAMAVFWNSLSKFDVGLITMFATGAMNQSKDAGSFFFARQRPAALPDPTTTTTNTTTTTSTVPPPVVVPVGSTIIPAPGAPAAIVTPGPTGPTGAV